MKEGLAGFGVTSFETDAGVSKNSGTPKSSILRVFHDFHHPFWSTPIVGNTPPPGENSL